MTQHPQFFPLLVGAFFLLIFGVQSFRLSRLRSAVLEGTATLRSWDPRSVEADEGPLCRHVRSYLADDAPFETSQSRTPRWLVTHDMAEVVDTFIEERAGGWQAALASTPTGIALLITFILIALVLTTEVPAALLDSAHSEQELAGAVRLLGQKFFISATGIGLSVVSLVMSAAMRTRVESAGHEAARVGGIRFCTAQVLAAATQVDTLMELRVLRGEIGTTRQVLGERLEVLHADGVAAQSSLVGMSDELKRLQSIDVVVKDLGSEVTMNIRKMLKEDLGEQIRDILQSVMKDANDVSEKLRTELLEGFRAVVAEEVPKITESLAAIQKSVDGQASSPVERMLEQLREVVGGGLRGESAQMGTAMRQFAEVVPALSEQLRTMATSVTQDMQARSEQSMRATEAMVAQVATLLERLDAQQATTEKTLAEIGQTMANGAQSALQQLQQGSTALVADVIRGSRSEMEQLLTRLEQAAAQNASTYANLDASVASAAKSILQARDGLLQTTEATRALVLETRGVISDAKQTNGDAKAASTGLVSAAKTLSEGLTAMRQTVDAARAQAEEQRKALEDHRRVFTELEQVWPKLFDRYLASFDEKSTALQNSWMDLHTKVRQLSDNLGGGLADAAEDLKDAVERTAKLHAANGKVA